MSNVDMRKKYGWTSDQMLYRYGASADEENSLAAQKRLGVADRLLARDPMDSAPRRRRRRGGVA
jgi:hypothetical protein